MGAQLGFVNATERISVRSRPIHSRGDSRLPIRLRFLALSAFSVALSILWPSAKLLTEVDPRVHQEVSHAAPPTCAAK
jgi:hypothetical protein